MTKPITRLRRRAKRGDVGFPKATLAFYGPDNKEASKGVLGIFLRDGADPIIHRYFTEDTDARYSADVQENILARIREHDVRSLIMMEKIFGCPHEEGIDYPEGGACPQRPFWENRDRFGAWTRSDQTIAAGF